VSVGNTVAKTSERGRQPRAERPDLRPAVDDREYLANAETGGSCAAAIVLICAEGALSFISTLTAVCASRNLVRGLHWLALGDYPKLPERCRQEPRRAGACGQ